ncbi:hypothetical protein HNR23_000414 [Nocardiopsis mwathae]|uniref:DUF2017 domain-containing protein n=1 Tax=Nocardiopsis mwathae TaxID=1472723 RepID=A0A7W9YE31_9ACTN|nr:DUF2017 domain-containing protein [Nocardiopsis mwathae]MBB6170354.1 hypothetical protein [Nocardiopsis mwathae]
MTMGFRPDSGGVAIDLDAEESAVLRSMAALLLDLVEEPEPRDELAELVGIGGSAEKPDDPVLARLFPDAYGEGTEASGDFRRYTEDDLRRHKRENARTMLSGLPVAGGTLRLDLAAAHAWMKALNDVRLALGTRLGVDEHTYAREGRGELSEGDAAALHIYDWLGKLQESLVQSLFGMGGGDEDGADD